MDSAGILKEYQGVAVHDCWVPYWVYECLHALCNAHLIRELIGVIEETWQGWTEEMIELQ
jgi:transposase